MAVVELRNEETGAPRFTRHFGHCFSIVCRWFMYLQSGWVTLRYKFLGFAMKVTSLYWRCLFGVFVSLIERVCV